MKLASVVRAADANTPLEKIPAVNTLVVKTSVVKTPVVNTPAANTPAVNSGRKCCFVRPSEDVPVICGFRVSVFGFSGFRFSGFGFQSDFGFQVSGFGFRVSDFVFRVSGFGFQVSCFGFRGTCFGFRVSGFGFRVFVGFRVSGFGFRLQAFGRVFGSRVSGFQFRVPRWGGRNLPDPRGVGVGRCPPEEEAHSQLRPPPNSRRPHSLSLISFLFSLTHIHARSTFASPSLHHSPALYHWGSPTAQSAQISLLSPLNSLFSLTLSSLCSLSISLLTSFSLSSPLYLGPTTCPMRAGLA